MGSPGFVSLLCFPLRLLLITTGELAESPPPLGYSRKVQRSFVVVWIPDNNDKIVFLQEDARTDSISVLATEETTSVYGIGSRS